ncbi:hypothetical protein AtubIFM54640_010192 [Aspergillus tubingensis]|uniref:Similar to An08g08380 n=1 Tax=Aspergillus niger TaxID=5061 RepID=A0A100IUN5_ASPNG|nr:similar to An08g08380 [Aspergillus tubingensis]GAQ47654.1 similar to An08g08380 [Aspergillus niger]GFN18635.1 similar to An08g08380 [Aspergillus tubingensis]GLA67214.1 hypothetical protein AtubIFM54640_010192 [Aspergillus tubingensis]
MPSSTTRNRVVLEGLFKTILEWRKQVPKDGHVNIRSLKDVEHVVQFDFENLDNAESNLAMVPPILFKPMDLADLERHPVDPKLAREFLDIDQDDSDRNFPIGPIDRVRQVSTFIEDRTTREARSQQGLQSVEAPESTFWLEAILAYNYSNNGWWTAECLVEPRPDNGKPYLHLAFHLLDDKEGWEDAILYSELCAIVEAMKGRANQRLVDSEYVREELDECGGRGKEVHPYLFHDEEHFPVLMVSCVLPQHARLFMACMSQRKLVIRQSKLYSFEWKDEAPVDLFARVFLSKPLVPRI